MQENNNPPRPPVTWSLWIMGGIALIWNGLGVILWSGTSFMPDIFLAEHPASYRDYVTGLPGWSMVCWGLGVCGGTLGALGLLRRKHWAVPVFALSLLGALANQAVYISHPPPDGFFNLPLTLFIIGFAVFVLGFSHVMKRRGHLG